MVVLNDLVDQHLHRWYQEDIIEVFLIEVLFEFLIGKFLDNLYIKIKKNFYKVGLARVLIISNVFFAHNVNASMKRASNELRKSLPIEKEKSFNYK